MTSPANKAGLVRNRKRKEANMLFWAAVFFIIAVIAGILGFTGVAVAATEIAKILFFVFLILFVVSLIFGWRARRPLV
jgi:uncharacterized membrane protein YtjA (UPF0391 family)